MAAPPPNDHASTIDDNNPFSSDPSPFSSQPPSPSALPASLPDHDSSPHAPASAAYPFSADPYQQHASHNHESAASGTETAEPVTTSVDHNDERSTSATSQSQAPASVRGRADSWRKTPQDVIQIVDALKTSEGASAAYIVYCIRYEGRDVRRRYSDFVSLRAALATLHPCFVVPPLPPKNTLSSYAIAGTNPAKAKEDVALIARRRRMLATFLNRTLHHKVLGQDRVFQRFLDPETPWLDVLHSPPVTLVPKNSLRAAASDPTDPDLLALFANLPLPGSSNSLQHPDQRFLDSESFTNKFSAHLSGSMEKVNRRLMKRWTDAGSDWSEMGGGMNGFALRMGEDGQGGLDEATEKVGMAVDAGYTLTNAMLSRWEQEWTEPLQEYTQFSSIIKGLLKYRHQKHLQYEQARELLESKRSTLEELERTELEAQRLAKALERVRVVGDDGSSESAMNSGGNSPTQNGASANQHQPLPPLPTPSSSSTASVGRKSGGGLLSALSHSVKGFVDSDPEASRRNTISKTREQINQLDDAIKALTADLRWASSTIQADLDRFQRQKVGDLREMCLDFSTFHKEWAQKNLAMWEEAKQAIDAIAD
ncbi:PX and BAR domain-containing protein [Sporobolomyces koalae]|uniref:PX and BAR domain-containing protein n=1 Tax=Sporobolomyces koalae TaxID=500713 RepID=UPI0031819949